jgi:MFS family permease
VEFVDWTHKYSLRNWIISLNLFCATTFEIGFFGSCFFLGYISSCLVFPPLADKHGRKIFIIAVQIEQGLCYLALIFLQNSFNYYVCIFIIGSSVPLKNMIAYTHLMEFLPGRVGAMSGFMIFLDGMILVVSPLILQYVSNNTDLFLWAALLMNVLGLAGFVFMYIPESIKFQLETGKYIAAKKDIEFVLRFNRSTPEQEVVCLGILDRLIIKKQSLLEKTIQAH